VQLEEQYGEVNQQTPRAVIYYKTCFIWSIRSTMLTVRSTINDAILNTMVAVTAEYRAANRGKGLGQWYLKVYGVPAVICYPREAALQTFPSVYLHVTCIGCTSIVPGSLPSGGLRLHDS